MNASSAPLGDILSSSTAQPLIALLAKITAALPTPVQESLVVAAGAVATASWKQLAVSGLVAYMGLVRVLRYRREAALRRKLGYLDRASLARMTNDEAQKIIQVMGFWEIPQFHVLSLQFGLFKTYGIESISRLLLGTRNLTDPIKSKKRYEDTAVIISEFILNPPTSKRAIASLARMNFLHSKYREGGQISNADLLYTLSVFVVEPPRFAKQYEWRPMNEMEVCAYGVFWKSIGDAMGIEYKGYLKRAETGWRDGLEFFEDIQAWALAYEIDNMKPSEINAKPAQALIPMITYWVPWFMKPFATQCVCVLMGDRVRDAFLLPEPGITAAFLVYSSLWMRRFVLKYLMLPRMFELERIHAADPKTGKMHLTAPHGNYPFYVKPTVYNRWGPEAWLIWIAGGVLPGENPAEYMPEGYSFDDLGPMNRANTGKAEMEADIQAMVARKRGGCPF